MPAPSPLTIATQSVQRLLKEETYYHKELVSQQGRVEKLEKELSDPSASHGENDEYMLKQEKRAMEETKTVFGPLRSRIADAVGKLEEQIAIADSEGGDEAELTKARGALEQGRETLKGEA